MCFFFFIWDPRRNKMEMFGEWNLLRFFRKEERVSWFKIRRREFDSSSDEDSGAELDEKLTDMIILSFCFRRIRFRSFLFFTISIIQILSNKRIYFDLGGSKFVFNHLRLIGMITFSSSSSVTNMKKYFFILFFFKRSEQILRNEVDNQIRIDFGNPFYDILLFNIEITADPKYRKIFQVNDTIDPVIWNL